MISLQRTVDLCFCQMLSRTRWVQNGGGNIFKNLWKVNNESNTQSTTWMPENWIWGQVWLHCTVSGVLHTQEHLETTLYCLRSIAHPRTLTNYTVLSPAYCTLISIYKPWERFHSIIWASCFIWGHLPFTHLHSFYSDFRLLLFKCNLIIILIFKNLFIIP